MVSLSKTCITMDFKILLRLHLPSLLLMVDANFKGFVYCCYQSVLGNVANRVGLVMRGMRGHVLACCGMCGTVRGHDRKCVEPCGISGNYAPECSECSEGFGVLGMFRGVHV